MVSLQAHERRVWRWTVILNWATANYDESKAKLKQAQRQAYLRGKALDRLRPAPSTLVDTDEETHDEECAFPDRPCICGLYVT